MHNEKTERVLRTLSHKKPDRIPFVDEFWPEFIDKWRQVKGLDETGDIYEYYNLTIKWVSANIGFQIDSKILEKGVDYVSVLNGFGSLIKKYYWNPIAEVVEFPIKSVTDYSKLLFEEPADDRRYKEEKPDIIFGDGWTPQPSFVESVELDQGNFCLFGSVLDPYEALIRVRGTEGTLMDMALHPEAIRAVANRIADFMGEIGRKQLEIGGLIGLWVWGDVAYDKGMFFSPSLYKEIIYPGLQRMCTVFKEYGAKIVYHSDGDIRPILPLLIDAGVDAIHPVQARAGMNLIELKRKYQTKLAFVGNIDLIACTENLEEQVVTKLELGREGGYIAACSGAVGPDIPLARYEYFIKLLKQYGVCSGTTPGVL